MQVAARRAQKKQLREARDEEKRVVRRPRATTPRRSAPFRPLMLLPTLPYTLFHLFPRLVMAPAATAAVCRPGPEPAPVHPRPPEPQEEQGAGARPRCLATGDCTLSLSR